jgi:hypothetical protein
MLKLARIAQDTPFDLCGDTWPWRAQLLVMAADHHVLLIADHHIICDGWSFDVLLQDLSNLYVSYTTTTPAPLPDLPVQYVDYADWQRRWLSSPDYQRQLDFWRRTLGSPPITFELECDRPRPAVQTFAGAVHRFDLPGSLVGELRSLGRAEGTSLFVVLLAAFHAVLSGTTGQRQVVVATPSANRGHIVLERLFGFFVNMLVISADLRDRPTFRELVRAVAESVLAADAHRDLPFEMVVDELLTGRDPSRPPIATVMFLMDTVSGRIRAGDLELERLRVDWSTAKYDLSLLVENVDDECHCVLEYNVDLFEPETVELLGRRWLALLTHVGRDPEARL